MMTKNNRKYVSDDEQLISEWNWEKNEALGYNPNKISYGSAIKVWWKCSEGHEWEASPNHRSRGRGCPVCSGLRRKETLSKNLVAKRGSLEENDPKLASQWHPTKNGNIAPRDVTVNSPKRVWWLCAKGHEWEAPINSRHSGSGCPVCSGYKIVVGVNDLATVRPDIAREWHPTKNGDLSPSNFTAGNDKKIWWICEKGHEWQARINNRVHGNNCPICIGKKVLIGYNDLATIMPILASEWHPTKNGDLTSHDVTVSSNKKVWWQCKRGHEWQSTISHRSNGRRCPQCFGESKTSFPEQAIFFYLQKITTAYNRYRVDSHTEIDIYLPEYKIGIEYDGAYFHKGEKAEQRERRKQEKLDRLGIFLIRVRELEGGTSNHTIYSKPGSNDIELTQTIKKLLNNIEMFTGLIFDIDVDISQDRNKIYEQYIQGEKANSLLYLNPKLALEWHPTKNGSLLPEYVSVHSNKKVWWVCDKGHEWQAVINSRRDGVGCPYCADKRAIVGYSDLATVNPRLADEWHPTKNGKLLPYDVTEKSNKFVWWRCKEGHEWRAMIYDRSNGCNCPICSGHKVLVGYNDLATLNYRLACEWHPTKNGNLSPSDVTCGSNKKVWWQCEKGHEWQAAVSSRSAGYGCPYCAGQKVIVGYNDLATINPELAAEWHPIKNGELKPYDVMAGAKRKVWWLGKCGHEWEAAIGSRASGRGCPYCANQKILTGFNDLATVNPKLASEWHPTRNGELTPKDIAAGSNRRVWWICSKGHEWENSVAVRNGGNGCPYCANQIVLKGYNDLATVNPELAAQWHPTKNGEIKPTDVITGSNKKAWWLGKCGHEWESVIASRCKGVGCPYCAGKKTLYGYNDLATTRPDLAKEWHPTKNGDLRPTDVTRGSNKKVWWICAEGHEWEATVNKRNLGRGCPCCSKNKK